MIKICIGNSLKNVKKIFMNQSEKKILMVMPILPFPENGADQIERATGIRQLKRLGFEVKVIAKLASWQDQEIVNEAKKEIGVEIITIPYKYSNKQLSFGEKIKKNFKKILNPFYLDGAAMEYGEFEIQEAFSKEIGLWKPDIVWFEYTYLWPLYKLAKKKNIPIVTRSHNFEPRHFLEEDGYSAINFLKFIPKMISEYITAKNSNVIFAITPREKRAYEKIGAKKVETLPQRVLSKNLEKQHSAKEGDDLNVFFAGASYNVHHNKKALEFILKEIIPLIKKKSPGRFAFHITGAKLPLEFNKYFNGKDVVYKGFVQDWESFVSNMDIALIPSLFGAGMQQKVFEPLARGIPTVTSKKALSGYPFAVGEHLLLAETANEFVEQILKLQDINLRRKLSENAVHLSQEIFSQTMLDRVVRKGLDEILHEQ